MLKVNFATHKKLVLFLTTERNANLTSHEKQVQVQVHVHYFGFLHVHILLTINYEHIALATTAHKR